MSQYNKPRSVTETYLQHYVKLNQGGSNIVDSVGGGTFDISVYSPDIVYTTETYPPLRFGASFICGRFSLTFPARCSLVYPVAKPYASVNFEPILSWTDDDGNFQRRKLWTTAGVDYTPAVALYAGELLPVNTSLEIWNVDGNATADLTEDLILRATLTTLPTTATDVEPVVVQVPTGDSTLAQNFPLTPFPLTFNSQQTYS